MATLKKTGRFLNRKGTELVVTEQDGEYKLTERANIQEVWISSGGSFNTAPIDIIGDKESFRVPHKDRNELLEEGYRLWKFDALGGTIVSMTTYFVLGRGVTFTFDEERAQFFAEKFYKKNELEMRLRSASDESVAFGDIFMWLRPKFTEVRFRGKVLWRLGDTQVTFVEPANITHIETAEEDPANVFNYLYEYTDGAHAYHQEVIPDISKYSFEGVNREQGCMVHIKLNSGNMDPYGHSDLIRVKEWLDKYQEYLRDGVIINKLYRSPCFDVAIEDGSIEEVNAAIARYRAWTIGSNPVHNAREKWQVLEFTGPNTSSENARRALLLIIAAGVGFAEYMLADGSNANLASSRSQQLPVIKKFEDRQDIFAHFLMKVMQFAIMAKAVIAKSNGLTIEKDSEGDPIDFAGQIKFPAIAEETDAEIANTNKTAVEGHWMSPRTAAARLNLDYAREVELMLQDQEMVKALEAAGIIRDPIEDAMKIAQAKGPPQEGGGDQGKKSSDNGKKTETKTTVRT
jgi:GTP cyclohydrolase II